MPTPFKRADLQVFGSPLITEADIQEVVDTLRPGWIGTGPNWGMNNEALTGIRGLILPPETAEPGTIHARHLYTVMIEPEVTGLTREEVMGRPKIAGIGTGVHYSASHLHKSYREQFGYIPQDFPNALWVSERTLSLPLSARMTLADAKDVIAALDSTLGR